MASKMKVEAVIKQGASIIGYIIVNENGNKIRIDRSYMCYMAAAGKIEGVTASLYNNKVLIRGLGKNTPVIKTEVEKEAKRTVTCIVKQGKAIIGCLYDGDETIIPRNKLEEDALAGKLSNVEAQNYKGKVLFRAINGSMKDIPVRNLNRTETEVSGAATPSQTSENDGWIKVKKKSYTVRVKAIPSRFDGWVVNKLEMADLYKALRTLGYRDELLGAIQRKDIKDPELTARLDAEAYKIDRSEDFRVNHYILRGTVGEFWIINRDKFIKTYEKTETPGIVKTKADGGFVFAKRIPMGTEFDINTSWGTTLHGNTPGIEHGKGDCIVCAANEDGTRNENDQWIVNGAVFVNTYTKA